MAKEKPIWHDISPKRKAFAQAWANHKNQKLAAIEAGYSEHSAEQQGSRLYNDAKVRAYCEYLTQTFFDKIGITREYVAKKFKRIADHDLANCFDENGAFIPIHQMPLHVRQNIASIENEQIWSGTGKNRVVIGTLVKAKFYAMDGAVRDLKRMAGYDEPDPKAASVKVTTKTGAADTKGDSTIIDVELNF